MPVFETGAFNHSATCPAASQAIGPMDLLHPEKRRAHSRWSSSSTPPPPVLLDWNPKRDCFDHGCRRLAAWSDVGTVNVGDFQTKCMVRPHQPAVPIRRDLYDLRAQVNRRSRVEGYRSPSNEALTVWSNVDEAHIDLHPGPSDNRVEG